MPIRPKGFVSTFIIREIHMAEVLIILKTDDPTAHIVRQQIRDEIGAVQSYGSHVFISTASLKKIQSLVSSPEIVGIYVGKVPETVMENLDETGRLGVAAWNERHTDSYRASKKQRKGEGLSWDHPDFDSEG
jgi:hypothetical protein